MFHTLRRLTGFLAVCFACGCTSAKGSDATTPLAIVATTPAAGAADVALTAQVRVTFSGVIDPALIDQTTFFLDGVPATVSAKCQNAFLTPSDDLTPSTAYTATITSVVTTFTWTFTTVGGLPTGVTEIAGQDGRYYAIRTDGSLWAWGSNTDSLLGDGGTTSQTAPIRVGSGNSWRSIAAGYEHTMAVQKDGTLWGWGNGGDGRLGDGSGTNSATPRWIGTQTDWRGVATGRFHTVAWKTDGSLWAWGRNDVGQLGANYPITTLTPIATNSGQMWRTAAAGMEHTLAIRADGTLWAWGSDVYGQTGVDGTTEFGTSRQVGTDANWKSIAAGDLFSAGVKDDGTLWVWGANENGMWGAGSPAQFATPTRIDDATTWDAVSAGHALVATRKDGSLWIWHSGWTSAAGATIPPHFVQLGDGKDWSKAVDAGGLVLAIRQDQALWTWPVESILADTETSVGASQSARVRFLDAPQVTGVTTATATAGVASVTVAWSEAANATSYDLAFGKPDDPTFVEVAVPCVTSPWTIDGLTPGVTYTFFVIASDARGNTVSTSAGTAVPKAQSTTGGDGCDAYTNRCGQVENGIEFVGGWYPMSCGCPTGMTPGTSNLPNNLCGLTGSGKGCLFCACP